MILVHGTSKNSISNIISSNKINSSQFDLPNYLLSLLTLYKGQDIPKNLNGQHVMWLGKGVYAFEATDYKLAKTWRTRYGSPKIRKRDCKVIQINLDFQSVKNHIINFSTKEGKSILLSFLDSEFDDLIQEMASNNAAASLKMAHLKNLGYNIIKEKYVDAPYVLGLFVELMVEAEFETVSSAKVIKATFSKGNSTSSYLETYVCIKDYSVIQSIQVC